MTTNPSSETVFGKIEQLLEFTERNEAYEERLNYYQKAKVHERYPQTTSIFSWWYISIPVLAFFLNFFVSDWNPFLVFVSYCALAIIAILIITGIYYYLSDKRKEERKLHVIYERVLQEEEPDADTMQMYKEEHESLWYDIVMDYNIPEEYQSETHLGDFLYYHQQGRAETLGQAYNVYEQVLHYYKMQQLAERQAEALEKKNEQDAARYKREEERFREHQAKLDDLESEMISTRHAVEEHNDWHRY